jgi:hypothetical protein
VEYLTIYRPYELVKLREEGKKGANGEAEAKDWDTALAKYTKAKDGYKIIKGGLVVSGADAIFWAILEKP